jgi:hypothetical protein
MMISFQRSYALLFFLLLSCSFQNGKEGTEQKTADDEKQPSYEVSLKLIASDIESPVGMAAPADGSNRIFIIEQTGTIPHHKIFLLIFIYNY